MAFCTAGIFCVTSRLELSSMSGAFCRAFCVLCTDLADSSWFPCALVAGANDTAPRNTEAVTMASFIARLLFEAKPQTAGLHCRHYRDGCKRERELWSRHGNDPGLLEFNPLAPRGPCAATRAPPHWRAHDSHRRRSGGQTRVAAFLQVAGG